MQTIITILFGFLNTLAVFLFPNQIKKPELSVPVVKKIVIPPKIIIPMDLEPSTQSLEPSPSVPWGTTEKLGDHLYRTYVGADEKMGTPAEILSALNIYRKNHGVGTLRDDENVCNLAQRRANDQNKAGSLDSHKGFSEFMDKDDSWQWLDVKSAGENASYGYVLSGVHLIEWVFNADDEHRNNQLNPAWNLACAGISGTTVDIIFGER